MRDLSRIRAGLVMSLLLVGAGVQQASAAWIRVRGSVRALRVPEHFRTGPASINNTWSRALIRARGPR